LITDTDEVKRILCSNKRLLKTGDYLGGSLEVVKRSVEDILVNPPQILGTSKKLKRGVTIPNLHHLLMFSYYTSYHHLMQYIGRIVRYEEGKVGKVFIFRTMNTYEETWFDKMNKIYDKNLNQIDEIDLRIKGYISSSNFK
jgi:predicted helicase